MLTLITTTMGVILSIIIAVIGYQFIKRQQVLNAHILDLQNQLTALCAGAVTTDERLLSFERALTKLKEQQGNLSSTVSPQHNYEHAIRLAKKGVASNQLIDSCNLSDEEAHLIEQMHGETDSSAFH